MTQELSHSVQVHPCPHQPRCEVMPKVMEPELLNAGICDQLGPPFLDVAHLEYLARAALARPSCPALQDFHGFGV